MERLAIDAAHGPMHDLEAAFTRAWPAALTCWSAFVKVRPPTLHLTTDAARNAGLTESFAAIRLMDQTVSIDLETVQREGLAEYAVEILAHEIGHHVLAPATLNDHVRCVARIRAGLPTLEVHAPKVANLYTDLLINDRLERSSGLAMHRVFTTLGANSPTSTSQLWCLYLRIMEFLWSQPRGTFGSVNEDARLDGDAWLGARLIRVYANEWIDGAGKFASLVLPYLVADISKEQLDIERWFDTGRAGAGGTPSIGAHGDGFDTTHPSLDPRLNEDLAPRTPASATGDGVPGESMRTGNGGGQLRLPWEYHEILVASGLDLSEHDAAVLYYRELASAHLVPFPRRALPSSTDEIPEGLEPWTIGDSFDTLDVFESLTRSSVLVPGVTTVKRMYGASEDRDPLVEAVDLDLYVDSSGSMPDPKVEISYPAWAGAIIALSALRAGGRVKVTLWSGPGEVLTTDGFVSDPMHILRVLTSSFRGSTSFPIHVLRETYPERPERSRRTHILHISDDGIDTLRADGDLPEGTTARAALARCGAGGTMVLQVFGDWRENPALELFDQEGWQIHSVQTLEELLAFATAFARKHYAPSTDDPAPTSRPRFPPPVSNREPVAPDQRDGGGRANESSSGVQGSLRRALRRFTGNK